MAPAGSGQRPKKTADKSGRRAPSQERSKALAAAVLAAASQVLEERGYRGATTTLVAERAGVSIGSLYQYFPNKEALLIAVLSDTLAGNAERFRTLAAGDGATSLLGGMVERFIEKRKLFKILLEDAPASIRVGGLNRSGYVAHVAAMLERLRPEDGPEARHTAAFVCVNAVIGVLHGWVLANPPPPGLTPATLAAQLEAVVEGYFQRL